MNSPSGIENRSDEETRVPLQSLLLWESEDGESWVIAPCETDARLMLSTEFRLPLAAIGPMTVVPDDRTLTITWLDDAGRETGEETLPALEWVKRSGRPEILASWGYEGSTPFDFPSGGGGWN